jgi:GntR family transcriptional regulator
VSIEAIDELDRSRAYRKHKSVATANRQRSASQAHALLRSAIHSGQIKPEEQLSEDDLIPRLGASRNAVREALQMLVDEGLVVRRPRHGTVVVSDIMKVIIDRIWTTPLEKYAGVELTKVDSRILVPGRMIRDRLELDEGEKVVMLEHLALSPVDQPICLRSRYLRLSDAMRMGPIDANDSALPKSEDLGGMRDIFQHLYGVAPGAGEVTLQALRCERRTSSLLRVPLNSPILMRELLMRDIDGFARELTFFRYPGDRTAFSLSASPEVPAARASALTVVNQ